MSAWAHDSWKASHISELREEFRVLHPRTLSFGPSWWYYVLRVWYLPVHSRCLVAVYGRNARKGVQHRQHLLLLLISETNSSQKDGNWQRRKVGKPRRLVNTDAAFHVNRLHEQVGRWSEMSMFFFLWQLKHVRFYDNISNAVWNCGGDGRSLRVLGS